MACDCKVCQKNAKLSEMLALLPSEQRQFWEDICSDLNHVEQDRDVLSAVLDGSWPSAKMQIEHAAKQLGLKLVPLD